MAAYLVIDAETTDPEVFAQYASAARKIVESHGGEYVLTSERITPASGDWSPKRIVVIRFKDKASLDGCFASPEYLAIAPLRFRSTRGRAVIAEDDS